MRGTKLEISPGFLFLWAVLFFLDTDGVAPWALSACGIHELAHILALRIAGGRAGAFRMTLLGAKLTQESRGSLSYGREILTVLAGPGVNLFLAALCARGGEKWYLFAGLNLSLGFFNLLPVPGLDGFRAVSLLVKMLAAERRR